MSNDLIVEEELAPIEAEQEAEAQAEPEEKAKPESRVDAWDEATAKKNYQELEKFNSRQAQELGSLRKSLDELLLKEQQPSPKKDIDLDALLENPTAAINQSLQGNPDIKALRESLDTIQKKTAYTEIKAKHPDLETIWQDPSFHNWVDSNPVRRKLVQQADNYDIDAADYIFTEWKSHNAVSSKEAEKTARLEKAKSDMGKAASEGAGGASASKIFSRLELANLKINDPERYEQMWESDIYPAYQTGRVR